MGQTFASGVSAASRSRCVWVILLIRISRTHASSTPSIINIIITDSPRKLQDVLATFCGATTTPGGLQKYQPDGVRLLENWKKNKLKVLIVFAHLIRRTSITKDFASFSIAISKLGPLTNWPATCSFPSSKRDPMPQTMPKLWRYNARWKKKIEVWNIRWIICPIGNGSAIVDDGLRSHYFSHYVQQQHEQHRTDERWRHSKFRESRGWIFYCGKVSRSYGETSSPWSS